MKNRTPLLHLLVVPLIALVVCNGITLTLLEGFSWYRLDLLKYLAVMAMTLYQAYLWGFHAPQKKISWPVWLSSVVALFWLSAPVPFFVWGLGTVALFSLARVLLLKREGMLLWHDFAYALVGSLLGFVFAPISLFIAVMIFVTIQVLCEMRVPVGQSMGAKDKFHESLKTARRVVSEYG